MNEIKTLLSFSEIEMIRDFMNPNSQCGIDNIHLEWTDEIYALLTSLGHIITQPGFETETWKQVYNLDPSKNNEDPIIPNDKTILYSVSYTRKGESTTIINEELWGNQIPKARENAKELSQKHKCDILITYTPKTIIETVTYEG